MRVPIRKPGKYTFDKADPHLTETKFTELKSKLERFKAGRPRLIEEVKRLASDGDFSENAAYQIAKGKLRGLNQRILETEDLLKRAIIIKPAGHATVQIGSTVIVEIAGRRKALTILGSAETDPAKGVISHKAPVGSALLGRQIGETVKIKLNNKVVEYKIISVK
jgi:transcription elongation factor GreA